MLRHTKRLAVLSSLTLLSACGNIAAPERHAIASFDVEVTGLFEQVPGSGGVERKPLQVVTPCARQYGEALADGGTSAAQDAVPAEVRGTEACRYAIPRGTVEFELAITAKGPNNTTLTDVNQPISFRVIPGDLTGGYEERTATLVNGTVTTTVRAAHVYGQVRVWAEDAPPLAVPSEEGLEPLPPEPETPRSFATGLSKILWFEDPTIQAVQIPDLLDNRNSPFVGQFLTIGKSPEAGGPQLQTCTDDPQNDGLPSLLVVTGSDPQGFFVTDVTACRLKELQEDREGSKVRTPEPNGYYPGRFASMYIYNYSYPEGLFPGDALWTVSGAIQEFTSTTQMTFPAWTIAESIHNRPPEEWGYYLDRVPPVDLNLRMCGGDDDDVTYLTDALCGHNRRNLKLESLESGLVRVKNVRFPQRFTTCDFNGDRSVPFYCELSSAPEEGLGEWGDCNFEAPDNVCRPEAPNSEICERNCNIQCTLGLGEHEGILCSERTTYDGFGQYVVEMAGPGPAEAGLDTSLPKRVLSLPLSTTSANTSSKIGANVRFDFQSFKPGTEVLVWCDAPVNVAFGDGSRVATSEDRALAAATLLRHTVNAEEPHVAVVANGDVTPGSTCQISPNMRTRINILSRDAVPDLEPDCDENDKDADRAEQCRFTRAASYDIVGHLRHLQPGRPRWAILPRDANDMCCHPGEGMECPRPLQACTN